MWDRRNEVWGWPPVDRKVSPFWAVPICSNIRRTGRPPTCFQEISWPSMLPQILHQIPGVRASNPTIYHRVIPNLVPFTSFSFIFSHDITNCWSPPTFPNPYLIPINSGGIPIKIHPIYPFSPHFFVVQAAEFVPERCRVARARALHLGTADAKGGVALTVEGFMVSIHGGTKMDGL